MSDLREFIANTGYFKQYKYDPKRNEAGEFSDMNSEILYYGFRLAKQFSDEKLKAEVEYQKKSVYNFCRQLLEKNDEIDKLKADNEKLTAFVKFAVDRYMVDVINNLNIEEEMPVQARYVGMKEYLQASKEIKGKL
jgi:hypothetical protein